MVRWPNSEIVARLPVPKSLKGKIVWESSEDFYVELINVTQAQYEDYVDACMDKGFTVDYYRDEEEFSASDKDGYEVEVDYDLDMLILGISIEEPYAEEPEESDDIEDEVVTTAEKQTTTTTKRETVIKTTATTKKAADSIDSDFKAAMDAYETFMNKYVDFMKKYKHNPTDLGLLADYATYMSDYADFVEDFEAWEDEDLNTAELAYYIDVQSRISKKMQEVVN